MNYFWQDADKAPPYDWEQWFQLFEVAVSARHSISMSELTREQDEHNLTWEPRVRASKQKGNQFAIHLDRKGRQKNANGQISTNQHSFNPVATINPNLQRMFPKTP